MNQKICLILATLALASCSHLSSTGPVTTYNQTGKSREIASTEPKLEYRLNGDSVFTTGFNPDHKKWYTDDHFIKGNVHIEKVNNENIPFIDLTWWYGSDEKDETGSDALCNAEIKYPMSPAAYLVNNLGWDSINLEKLEKITKSELVEACEKIGGAPVKKNDEINYYSIASKDEIRIRGFGPGYSGLIPAPRKCLFYRAKMSCDLTNIKDKFQDLLTLEKERINKVIEYKKEQNQYMGSWEKYYQDISNLDAKLNQR